MSSNDMSRQQLHSILVNHGSFEEESFFRGAMRPRANSEPLSPRPLKPGHVHFDLPDIVVDDCSDNDEMCLDNSRPEELNKELTNTDEGAFSVYKSPPRQRSNTCPSYICSKQSQFRINNRPPTPPPNDDVSRVTFTRYPSWEKVQFSPHPLSSVDEARDETTDKRSFRPYAESSVRERILDGPSQRMVKQKVINESPSASHKGLMQKFSNGLVTMKSNDTVHPTV